MSWQLSTENISLSPEQSLRRLSVDGFPRRGKWLNKDCKPIGRKNIYFERCAQRYYFTTSLMTHIEESMYL